MAITASYTAQENKGGLGAKTYGPFDIGAATWLFAFFCQGNNGTPNTVKWNGDALTHYRADEASWAGGKYISLWGMLNPDQGNYSLTFTGTTNGSCDVQIHYGYADGTVVIHTSGNDDATGGQPTLSVNMNPAIYANHRIFGAHQNDSAVLRTPVSPLQQTGVRWTGGGYHHFFRETVDYQDDRTRYYSNHATSDYNTSFLGIGEILPPPSGNQAIIIP